MSMKSSSQMFIVAGVVAGAMIVSIQRGYAHDVPQYCETVSIESAGAYRIKSSRMKPLVTLDNRTGIALAVELWPPEEKGLESELIDLIIYAAPSPSPAIDCTEQHNDFQLSGGFMSYAKDIPGFSDLRVQASFKLTPSGGYKRKMAHLVEYVVHDVMNCGAPGTPL